MAGQQSLPQPRRHAVRVIREEAQAPRQRRQRSRSAFEMDVQTYAHDAQVRALSAARTATFKVGENVDQLTTMLRVRIQELKGSIPTRIMP